MYGVVRTIQLSLAVFCLALLRVTVFAQCGATNQTNEAPEIRMLTFELGSNVTLFCGNINLSSSTELSWSRGENILLNITSHNSTLVLSNLTEEGNGLYICMANSSQILRKVQLSMRTNGADNGGEEEEEEIQDEGLTDVDNIAIALGLGLTTFIIVSMAVLLYRAEKRRRHAKYMQKWRITVKGRENMAVEEEIITTKPVSKNDFHLRNGPRAGHKHARANMTPAEYRWLETLGRENEIDGNQNRIGAASMWRATAYV
ncbi:hypothetical protein ACROYT_G011818 [Oculina patagonica]